MSRINKGYLLLLLLFSAGCGPKQLAPEELVRYVEDPGHGLQQTVASGDWRYTVQYKPADYIIVMESRGMPDEPTYQQRKKDLAGSLSFNVSFKNEKERTEPLRIGVKDMQAYNERLSYYLNEAGRDMLLIAGKDTLYTADYLFEPNYNLLPQQNMIVSFRLPPDYKPGTDVQLVFLDKIFNNGIIKAFFSGKHIAGSPTLKRNSVK